MEVDLFETSEAMANFLASTQLLSGAWRVCSAANVSASAPSGTGFVIERAGPVAYLGFSGIQIVSGSDLYSQEMVPLSSVLGQGGAPFSGLDWQGRDEDEDEEKGEPVMVHKGLLQLFFTLFNCPIFQNQLKEIRETTKSVVLTGQSIGGSTASLMALWLLCDIETNNRPPKQLLCITFGSPLLGNKSLSKALHRQRWAGNFCHVVLKHDIVPRLLFAPLPWDFGAHLQCLLQYWQLSMGRPQMGGIGDQVPAEEKSRFLEFVMDYTRRASASESAEQLDKCLFSPFGTFMLCSVNGGAICVDNSEAVVKLLHLMMIGATNQSCYFEDHLKYGDCVERVSWRLLRNRGLIEQSSTSSPSEVGMQLALEAMGITSQDPVCVSVKNCLMTAKQVGRNPNLAIRLSKITPYRALIEWYKASCDNSDDQLGYYDSFKRRQASIKDNEVNMFRLKLARFWNDIIAKLDRNELPQNFQKRAKWVNASHFYQLLVEPLDIAEYYRLGLHRSKGHYLQYGRERRHKVIDKWWRSRKVDREENHRRSKFAGLTEDSCFWAKLEEARELLEKVRRERSEIEVWTAIETFERDAREMIESRKVSRDVLAKNSSYSLWVEELGELRSQLQQFHCPPRPGFLDGEMVP